MCDCDFLASVLASRLIAITSFPFIDIHVLQAPNHHAKGRILATHRERMSYRTGKGEILATRRRCMSYRTGALLSCLSPPSTIYHNTFLTIRALTSIFFLSCRQIARLATVDLGAVE